MSLSKYFLILLLFPAGKTLSQPTNYIFDHLSKENVLSSNKTEAVIQDRDGIYWIATADGLNRFDGTHCKIFRNDKNDSNSLSNNQCTALAEDIDGNIWVGTNKGFCKYSKKTNKFQRFYLKNKIDNFDPLNRISSICLDKENNVWIGSFRLSVYDRKTKQITIIPPSLTNDKDYKKVPYANQISYDAVNNAIWYHSSAGVRYYNIDSNRIFYEGNNPAKIKIFNPTKKILFRVDSNLLWYYDIQSFSLYSLNLATLKEKLDAKIIINSPKALYTGSNHELWISSWNSSGILYNILDKTIDSTFFNRHHDKSALSGNIKSAYLDKSGNYWFCSTEGISILNSQHQRYKYFILDKNQGIVCGVATNKNKIIFSTQEGMIEYEPLSGSYKNFTIPGIDNKKIKTLTLLSDTLIAGTDKQAVYFDIKKHTVISRISFDGTAQFIIKDNANNLWIGTWGKGLYRYDNKKLIHFDANTSAANGLLKNSLVCATTGQAKNLWIGYNGGGGFAKYDYSTQRFINYKINLSSYLKNNVSNTVTALEEDSKGNVWIGTYGGGLYYFDTKADTFSMYLQSDGLLSNFINKLIIADDHLWISTSNGINYMQLPSGKIEKLNIDFIFPSDDVVNSGFTTNEGVLYFFCRNKILKIDPSVFFSSQEKSKLVISSFKVFDTEVFLEKKLPVTLNYDQNFFSFDFSLLKTNPTAEIKYAYKLQGLNNDWVYTTNPSANYTNVAPGNYTLLIKASSEDGSWMDPISVSIIITPPFWKTWWFYLLMALLFFSILYFVFRYRINQLKKIILLRSKISQDLHDEVGSALSGIALYSYLTKTQIKNNEKEKVNDSLEVIQNSATDMVTKLSDIVWAINPGNDSLPELLQRLEEYAVEMATVKNIEFSVTGTEVTHEIKLPMNHRKNIYLIFKEAINNAIKYSGCAMINLGVNKNNNRLVFDLTDDGGGFNTEKQKKGNGLINMQDRAKEIDATYSLTSSLKGTCVHLSFKIPQ